MSAERPRYLLIETSGRVGRLGLAAGEELLAERELDPTRRHARDLAPTLDELLRERGWRPGDLSGVIVSLGPGSYTGLRVGVVSAQAFAFATGCLVVGMPTFEVIARHTDVAEDAIEVVADAQRMKLYVQPFRRPDRSQPFLPEAPIAVLDGPGWARERGPATPVVGPGLPVAGAWLPAATPAIPSDATVAGLLSAGLARWHAGQRDDPLRLEPIYLRPSSAEEQWGRRGTVPP